MVGKRSGKRLELVAQGKVGVGHVRVEMGASAFADDLLYLFKAERLLVVAFTGEGVVHIGQGHQPSRHGNGFACQASRVSGAIPFFVVALCNFAGHLQKAQRTVIGGVCRPKIVGLRDVRHGFAERVCANLGMRFHDLELVWREARGFEQHRIGYADLANVVQRRSLDDEGAHGLLQRRGKAGVCGQVPAQCGHIGLGAGQVVAGLVVAFFGQQSQCVGAHVLDEFVLLHAPRHFALQMAVLVLQPVACALQFKVVFHPCQQNGRPNGLGDVVHRAKGQATGFVVVGVHGRHKNHRYAAQRGVGLQVLDDGVAVHARHHDVQQNDVGPGLGGSCRQRPLSRIGNAHPVMLAQQFAQHGQVGGGVVNHQHGLLELGWCR